MDEKRIKILIERYFEAETTSEEEDRIIRFFRNSSRLPQDLEQLRPMFEGISRQEKEKTNKLFEEKTSALIDGLFANDTKSRFLKRVYMATGVAAAIIAGILFFSIWRYSGSDQNRYIVMDTYSDPQQGYEAAKAILGYVSANYSVGLSQLNNIPYYPEEALHLFRALEMYNKGLSKLEVITNINIK
jgi:hypothetical protein